MTPLPSELDGLVDAIRRERRADALVGLCFALVAAAICVLALSEQGGYAWFFGGLASFTAALAAAFLRAGLRPVERHPLLVALAREARPIRSMRHDYFGDTPQLSIRLVDGATHHVTVRLGEEHALLAALARRTSAGR